MAILYNQEHKIFTLQTKHTTYQMMEGPYGFLLHLYYGKKIQNGFMDYLITRKDVGCSPNPDETGMDRTFSPDILPQEYSTYGVTDFRDHSIAVINSDGSRAADFRYVSHEIRKGAYQVAGMPALYDGEKTSDTLVIHMCDKVTGLELNLFYGVFEEEDIITRAVTFVNGGRSAVSLEKIMSLHLDMPHGQWEMVHFYGRHAMERQFERVPLMHGTMSVGSKRGTSSHHHNPSIILCSPETTEDFGECYGMSLIYSGNFTAEVEVDQMSQTRVMMGISPELFSFRLEPGESFDTPQAIMTFSMGGFTEMSSNFHRIIRHNLCRGKYKLARRPILVNNWEATYFEFDEKKIYSIAEPAAKLGFEMLVLDDGWFGKRDDDNTGLGDWVVNEDKLQGGLKKLVEKINRTGMRFGIWVEPEMVSEDSDLYREHEDWVLRVPGRKPARSRNQLVLDISRQDVRDYLFESIAKVLRSANIEYVKWDMNRSICDVYSESLPKERQGEVSHRYVLGLYQLLERFVTEFPDILFEGCSGGGARFDPAMLYYSPLYWCSDNTDPVERLEIQYGTSFFYPISTVGSHVSASPNHQSGRSTPLTTRGIVAMSGNLGYEMDLNLLTEAEKEIVKGQVEDYKKYCDLIHNGTYYRVVSPTAGSDLCVWQFVSQDKKESLVNIVTTHVRANLLAFHIRLKGLEPELLYHMQVEGVERVYSGECLMNAGISMRPLLGDYPSVQLHLKAVEQEL